MKTTCSILLIILLSLAKAGYSQTAVEYHNNGWLKYDFKDYSGAISDFSKAIELDPNCANSFYGRGNAKSNIKDYSGAISDFSKAIELDPNDAFNNYSRGYAKSNLKDYSGAIADYTKAIELDPNEADYNYFRGNAKSNLKDYIGAIVDYTKAIELAPTDASYYESRGLAKGNSKDYTGAFADYSKALEIDPKDSEVYYDRGLLKITVLGQKESGCLDLNKAGVLGYVKAYEAIKQYCQNLPKALPSQNDNFNAKSDTVPTWENTVAEKVDKSKLREVTDFVPPKALAENMSKTKTDQTGNSNLHFQIDKIKVGDTFIELPIPNGFVKVDDKMGVLIETAKKLCPITNTLLAYYISEEDYANFLVNQDHLVQKYILVEVYNNFKNINVGNKDYRQFIKSFKEKHVEEFKQLSDEAGQIASENLSNIDEKVKVQDFKMQLFGICYESKNSISYGALTKYNVSVDNEISKDFIVAGISTITKIENKPIFLMLNKSYSKNEDITILKTINSGWIKEVDKRQSPVSFFADIDFKDYKETILAILTLSALWAIYFATKKIHRNIIIKKVSENLEKENINYFVDFDELLVEETLPIKPICIEPEEIQKNFQIINPELLKVGRLFRAFHALIDLIIVYLVAYCIGYAIGFLMGNSYAGNMIGEHPYLYGLIVTFIAYFSQEFIFGKTLGKLITGTHVVNNLGKKPTTWQLILRTVSRLIPLDGLSFLTSDKRGWHDTISSTFVIKD